MYAVCARMSQPLEQIGSFGTHRSMVLSAYCGAIDGRGPGDSVSANALCGAPKSAAAATWSAICGGAAVVDRSITPAPWEYPPNTSRVVGQLAVIAWMWALASRARGGAGVEIAAGRVV